MDFNEQLIYTIPLYLGPLLFFGLVDIIRKTKRYRINESLTNASIALGNLGFSFVILIAVMASYHYIYNNYSLFTLDQSSPWTYLIAFLLYDFFFYCNHRLHHMIGLFWVDHLVHHSAENMNFGVAIRNSYFIELTMWMTFGLIAFAGISLEVFLIVSYIEMTWAFLIHTVSFKNTPILDKFINTPSLHRVHHARSGHEYIDKNFGGILVIWDKIFGTYQREMDDKPINYGVAESFYSFSPIVINLQYLSVIKRKIQKSRGLLEVFKSIFFSPGWIPTNATARDIFDAKALEPAERFQLNNPIITLYAKIAALIRFAMTLIIFIGLMWFYADLSILQNMILSILFLWSCHYIGITLDGKNISLKTELFTQAMIYAFAVSAYIDFTIHPFLIDNTIAMILFSAVSLGLYLITNKDWQAQHRLGRKNDAIESNSSHSLTI